jgi:transposase
MRDAEPERDDRRWVRLKDEPLRTRQTFLRVRKRRFWCASCKKPFTESLPGVRKGTGLRSDTDGACFLHAAMRAALHPPDDNDEEP